MRSEIRMLRALSTALINEAENATDSPVAVEVLHGMGRAHAEAANQLQAEQDALEAATRGEP